MALCYEGPPARERLGAPDQGAWGDRVEAGLCRWAKAQSEIEINTNIMMHLAAWGASSSACYSMSRDHGGAVLYIRCHTDVTTLTQRMHVSKFPKANGYLVHSGVLHKVYSFVVLNGTAE